jgi:hypothetical protein
MKKPRHPQKHVTNVTKKMGKTRDMIIMICFCQCTSFFGTRRNIQSQPTVHLACLFWRRCCIGLNVKAKAGNTNVQAPGGAPKYMRNFQFFWPISHNLERSSAAKRQSGAPLLVPSTQRIVLSICYQWMAQVLQMLSSVWVEKSSWVFKRTFYKPCPTWISMVNM